jgi:O-antigen/teichoic acid export membrane protein
MSPRIAELKARAVAWPRNNPTMVQTVIALAVKLFAAALSFAFTLLMARLFGAAGTGVFALALATATLASTVSLLGLDFLLLRGVARDLRLGRQAAVHGLVRAAVRLVLLVAGAAALGLALSSVLPLQRLIGLDPMLPALAALAVVPMAMGRLALATLRSAGRPVIAQWMDGPLAMSVSFVALIGMTLTGFGLAGAPALFVIHAGAILGSSLLGWWLVRGIAAAWPAPERVRARSLVSESWRLSAITLSMLAADWLLLLLINRNASAADVGQFRVAFQIITLVSMIVATFETVVGPQVAAAHGVGDMAAIRRLYAKSVKVMLLLSAPVFALMLAVPGWVLGFFGPEFSGAVPVLRIMALGQLVNVACGPLGSIIMMTGNERWTLRLSGMSVPLVVALGVLLVGRYGMVGAALASAATLIFRNLFSLWVVRSVIFSR